MAHHQGPSSPGTMAQARSSNRSLPFDRTASVGSISTLPSPPSSPSKAVPHQEAFRNMNQRKMQSIQSAEDLGTSAKEKESELSTSFSLSDVRDPVDSFLLTGLQDDLDKELVRSLKERIPKKVRQLKVLLNSKAVEDSLVFHEYYEFLSIFTTLLYWLQSRKPAYSSGTTLIASVQEEMFNWVAACLQIVSKNFADTYVWIWKAQQLQKSGTAVLSYAPPGGIPSGSAAQSISQTMTAIQAASTVPESAQPEEVTQSQMVMGGMGTQMPHQGHPQPRQVEVATPNPVSQLFSALWSMAKENWKALIAPVGAGLLTFGFLRDDSPIAPWLQKNVCGASKFVQLGAAVNGTSWFAAAAWTWRKIQHQNERVQRLKQYELVATAGMPSFWVGRLLGATPDGKSWWIQWLEDARSLPNGERQYSLGTTQMVPLGSILCREVPNKIVFDTNPDGLIVIEACVAAQLHSLQENFQIQQQQVAASPMKSAPSSPQPTGQSPVQDATVVAKAQEEILTTPSKSPIEEDKGKEKEKEKGRGMYDMECIVKGEKRHLLQTMIRSYHAALSEFHQNRHIIFAEAREPDRDHLYA